MREMSSSLASGFHFGLESSRIADRLEDLAKGMRDGTVIPHKTERAVIDVKDDFQTERMTFEFTERTLRNEQEG